MKNVVTVFIKEAELSYSKMCLLTVRVWHQQFAGIDIFWLERERESKLYKKLINLLKKVLRKMGECTMP